jgi:hypothetical protein
VAHDVRTILAHQVRPWDDQPGAEGPSQEIGFVGRSGSRQESSKNREPGMAHLLSGSEGLPEAMMQAQSGPPYNPAIVASSSSARPVGEDRKEELDSRVSGIAFPSSPLSSPAQRS